MTKPTFLILLLLSFLHLANAQLSSARYSEKMDEAQEFILSEDYNEALIILKELGERAPGNANLDFRTGLCFLNSPHAHDKALPFLKRASMKISEQYNSQDPLEQNAPVETWLYLGDAYRFHSNFAEAEKCYRRYATLSSNPLAASTAEKRIRECQTARILQKRPLQVRWEMLGSEINQGIANQNPVVSADGSTLVFTRRMKFYDAVMISRNQNGQWSVPDNITTQIGSDGEYYPTGISADGNRMLLQCYNVLTGYDLYESTWNGSRWTKLKKLDKAVNSPFAEINGTYAPDGKAVFFSSNRENGLGGYDIYRSELRADGSWSKPINLGPSVNTRYDEKFPNLTDNGKMLIFSSQGHLNMGGLDLFYIEYPLTSDAKAKNIGYPINTVGNDQWFYPVLQQNNGFAYRYEDQSGLSGIMKATYSAFSGFFAIPVKATIRMTGTDDEDAITMCVVDLAGNDTVEFQSFNPNAGEIDFLLYPGKFRLYAENSAQHTTFTDFSIPEKVKGSGFQLPLSLAFQSKTPENIKVTADTFQIYPVNFDFNSYALSPGVYQTLDKLAGFMETNTGVQLLVTGFSDALGPEVYNRTLSARRAEEVMTYLVKKGIDENRIKTNGKGSSSFIAVNVNPDGSDNPAGRSYNRRVEFSFKQVPSEVIVKNIISVPENLKIK